MNDLPTYSRENYVEQVIPFIDKPLIKVITGIRRSGKSTILQLLMEHLIQKGISKQQILYINMESYENLQFSSTDFLFNYVRNKRKESKERFYLFIDEVQEIFQWEKITASFLADDDADIFITGSNSHLLSGELASLITGRYVEFTVYPLVFSEYCLFRKKHSEISQQFNEFLLFGGFPGIHSLDFDKNVIYQYLSSLKDSIVLKDIVLRNRIRDVHLLEKIILFLASNIGNIVSGRKIADYFKNERQSLGSETVYNYIKFLESAFLISRASRFDLKGKKLLETNEKYYLMDLGLSHALLGYREKDINAYLENIVYIELKKRGFKVMIGKFDEFEVDFVCEKNSERIYIQVAYLLADNTVWERETRPFYKINDNFPKYLLTMDQISEGNTDGIFRKYLPNFLLGV